MPEYLMRGPRLGTYRTAFRSPLRVAGPMRGTVGDFHGVVTRRYIGRLRSVREGWAEAVIGAPRPTFMRGTVDLHDLFAAGRNEDAADQFASVMLLREGVEGARALQAVARLYESGYGYGAPWDTHSPDPQRYFDIICMLYGKHYTDDVGESVRDLIPQSQTVRYQYADAEYAWSLLLERHAVRVVPAEGS